MYINQFISKIDLYLEGQSEGLVSSSGRGDNRVEGLKEGVAISLTLLDLNSPSLVPAHPLHQPMLALVCNMLSPCHPEMGTKGTAAGLYPTFLMKPDTSF